MIIRMLKEEELIPAAGLSRYVFDACLRNRMEFTQSIPFIENYISETNIRSMSNENKLVVWGVFEEEQLVAVGGMQTDGMITLLYVLPQYFGRGCGMNLLQVMRGYANDVLHLPRVLVNATPAWTSVYFKKQGFEPIHTASAVGVPFVSMQAMTEKVKVQKKERISGLTILLAILACVGFATIASVIFMLSYLM
ncbi:MAG: GNAT family N-acetyltransferase [Agathobacter sp.]|nr:GNAT family N-acetyltransferase [Agathobacter sp.]